MSLDLKVIQVTCGGFQILEVEILVHLCFIERHTIKLGIDIHVGCDL
jgi:hypothetical protein